MFSSSKEFLTEDAVGKTFRFPTTANSIIRRFGVPRKMLVEVSFYAQWTFQECQRIGLRSIECCRNLLLSFATPPWTLPILSTQLPIDQVQRTDWSSVCANRICYLLTLLMSGLLAGPRGCGKSVLLLQTSEYAASKVWIVMYIPRGTLPGPSRDP